MNIFLTDPDPHTCAVWLDDVRVSKMTLETAQLLSTTCNLLLPGHTWDLYKTTHMNHPCALFARKNLSNFNWLVEHGLCLAAEFDRRFGHAHKSEQIIILCHRVLNCAASIDLEYTKGWARGPLTFSFNCSGYDTGDIYRDYQLRMCEKWDSDIRRPQWKRRQRPHWYTPRV